MEGPVRAAFSSSSPRSGVRSALLEGVRVLDLTHGPGYLCGKILADMGADVVLIEPPAGSPGRRVAPFAPGVAPRESSLSFWAQNSNKRGVTLDYGCPSGAELLERLLTTADILIEDHQPGEAGQLGFGYNELRSRYPSLIYVSISPYGQDGPYSQLRATDLTLQGMGTHMTVTGDRDRAPCRLSIPAAYYHGASAAAAAAMIALFHASEHGEGQHIDVSMQAAVIWTLLNTTMTWQLTGRDEERGGAVRKERASTIYTRLVWPCRDGLVHFTPIGGGGGTARVNSYEKLVQWMEQEGSSHEVLRAKNWNGADGYSITQDEYDQLARIIGDFLQTKTVSELYERAVRDRLLLAPVSTIEDLFESPQIADREALVTVWNPQLGRAVTYPGPFAKLSVTELRPPSPAPTLGEHNGSVYGALGIDGADLERLQQVGVI